jgi:hypothetical protein
MPMPDPEETTRLREAQAQREQDERELASHAAEADERRMHERRSDNAAYLREKLEEQRRSPDR